MRTPSDLRAYQVRGAKRIYREPGVGLFVDMGLGKTASTLTGIRGLLKSKHRRSALVVMPLRVLDTETWQDEVKAWSHTQHLRCSVVHGKPKQRLAALKEKADLYLTNYENLKWLAGLAGTPSKPTGLKLPDILVLDESSMIKNPGSMRFRAIRDRLHRFFKTVVILTGTPMPNSLLEVWPQIYVLDRGQRLGTSFTRFKQRFFYPIDYNQRKWVPYTGAYERVMELIADIVLRLDQADWIKMPDVVKNVVRVPLPEGVMDTYTMYEREMFMELSNDKAVSAATAATLSMQCQQIANGAIYDDEEDRTSWTEFHEAKLDALEELVDEHPGQSILVAYWFRHDLARLRERFPSATAMDKKNAKQVKDDWNAGKIPLLFVQPRASGHGLNMQHGGHIIVWFSLTWSSEAHDQLIGRLRRPDQKSDSIICHYIVARDTVDEAVLDALRHKVKNQKDALDVLRAYTLRKEGLIRRAA